MSAAWKAKFAMANASSPSQMFTRPMSAVGTMHSTVKTNR